MLKRNKVPSQLQKLELMELIIKQIDWHRPLSPEPRKTSASSYYGRRNDRCQIFTWAGLGQITGVSPGPGTLPRFVIGVPGPGSSSLPGYQEKTPVCYLAIRATPVRYRVTGGKLLFVTAVPGVNPSL